MASFIFNKKDYILSMFVMLVVFVQAMPYKDSGGNGKGSISSSSKNRIQSSDSSLFTTRNNTRVIAQRGGLAVLPCSVKWNPTATVSWIRRRDFQLLTVGLSTYSSDDRFLVEHARHMGHWSLRIKSVRDEDKGLYECQLSVHPTQSIYIELKVVEAVADILGAPDLHIDEGSTLRLECRLKRATENPAFVFWYHNSKMVNYDVHNGFSVSSIFLQSEDHFISNTNSHREHELQQQQQQQLRHIANGGSGSTTGGGSDGRTINQNSTLNRNTTVSKSKNPFLVTPSISILTIKQVNFLHVGNYTCAPSNAKQASITVHVLRGEKPAAMQHANRSAIDDGSEAKTNSCWNPVPTKSLHIFSVFYLISLIKTVHR